MTELKALIFDVDGTLADTERDGHRVAFNKAFAEAGLDWHWDAALYGRLLAVTGGKERILYYANDFLQDFAWPEKRDAWVAGLHRLKTRHYLEMLEQGEIPLRSGVSGLISEARSAGLLLAIATTTTPANVTQLLKATLGLESPEWFAVIAAGDVVPAKKPAPDIYIYALQRLGLKADQCIAFEDSHNGLLSARGAGLKTIISTNSYTAGEDFSGAELVIDKWGTPEDGFRVIAGDAGKAAYLDLELVRRIHFSV